MFSFKSIRFWVIMHAISENMRFEKNEFKTVLRVRAVVPVSKKSTCSLNFGKRKVGSF